MLKVPATSEMKRRKKMSKTQKESQELETLDGQLSLDDIIANADDGTYGKPIDEYEVQS